MILFIKEKKGKTKSLILISLRNKPNMPGSQAKHPQITLASLVLIQ